jgi:hypothetical protein
VPIFWSVAVSGAIFGMFSVGFSYHAVDIMKSLADMTATETADYVFVPMSIALGLSSFCMGMI